MRFMFTFDIYQLFLVIILGYFLPGSILGFALFFNPNKEKKGFSLLESKLIGFSIALVAIPIISFIPMLLGVKFSLLLTYFSISIFYVFAIYFFIKNKAKDKVKYAFEQFNIDSKQKLIDTGLNIILFIILFLTFFVRFQTLGPVYTELDPYYYDYGATQLINSGQVIYDDKTAWVPEVVSSHRGKEVLYLLEAQWYELYTQGGEYNKYLLSTIAAFYPPLVSSLMIFFIYLLIKSATDKKYAIAAIGLLAFMPMNIMKTLAGESEVQPWAFFSLSFFFSSAFLYFNSKLDYRFLFLVILSYFAVYFGCSSISVVQLFLLLFVITKSLLFLLDASNQEQLKSFAIKSAVIAPFILIFTLLMTFYSHSSLNKFGVLLFLVLLFPFMLFYFIKYLISKSIDLNKKTRYISVFILFLFGFLFLISPFSHSLTSFAKSVISIGQFNAPLDRTIAEQKPAGDSYDFELGFPATITKDSIFSLITQPFTLLFNLLIKISDYLFHILLNTKISTDDKQDSLLYVFFIFSVFSLTFEIFLKKSSKLINIGLFFLLLSLPISYIGFHKDKYTIYMGWAFVIMFAVSLYVFSNFFNKQTKKYIYLIGLLILTFSSIFQFFNQTTQSILSVSFAQRFSEDPKAYVSDLKILCNQTKYEKACDFVKDPDNFLSEIQNQYDPNLCVFSLLNNDFSNDLKKVGASLRCNFISPYWLESMEWISKNTPKNARFTSWWDYGHGTNFFGERNTVTRNEHSSHHMIEQTAYSLLQGTPEELKEFMLSHNSTYLILDKEIILSGQIFGAKYGALNYLSCAYTNDTNVNLTPGQSQCEKQHLWENLVVLLNDNSECTISDSLNLKGKFVYDVYTHTPLYCLGKVKTIMGEINGLYYLNKKDENGDLKVVPAVLMTGQIDQNTILINTLYINDPIFIKEEINGSKSYFGAKDSDLPTDFYRSNLYNGFMFDRIPGFEKVFETSDKAVKIFRIKGE